jgi:hypothetical protein
VLFGLPLLIAEAVCCQSVAALLRLLGHPPP